jgi:dihydroneopterin aldolase
MSDLIRVRGLRIKARIGVTEEERAEPQTLTIDVELKVDARKAGRSDSLADTVDYSQVVERIERVVSAGETRLLERLAQRIVDEISVILGVEGVAVEVSKKAPIPHEHDLVAVRLERP